MSNNLPTQDNHTQDVPLMPAPERAPSHAEQIAEIAAAVAELQAARVASDVAANTTVRRIRPFEAVMVTLLAVSLLIHALTIARLLSVRNTLRDEVGQLAGAVQSAKAQSISYTLPIDQQVPIDVNVPIQNALTVPINTQVRIKQDITVPVDTGFGSINIPIPLDTTIPVSTTVPINIDQTVHISTTVPIKLSVPIQLDLGSDQLGGYLDRLYAAIIALRDRF